MAARRRHGGGIDAVVRENLTADPIHVLVLMDFTPCLVDLTDPQSGAFSGPLGTDNWTGWLIRRPRSSTPWRVKVHGHQVGCSGRPVKHTRKYRDTTIDAEDNSIRPTCGTRYQRPHHSRRTPVLQAVRDTLMRAVRAMRARIARTARINDDRVCAAPWCVRSRRTSPADLRYRSLRSLSAYYASPTSTVSPRRTRRPSRSRTSALER